MLYIGAGSRRVGKIAAYCRVRFAIGVSSGTDALLAALMAIGVGPGDEVVTTAYSFFATAGVIARLGACPVFVDIDAKTFNLESTKVGRKITARTKAIMRVHLFGQCAGMDPIMEVVKDKEIHVIEDAAQAIGACDKNGRQAGTIGHMGCFSFFPSKNLGAFGDAGMVITNDEHLAETVQVLRVHGAKPKYHHSLVGGNFRLDALQAAILRVKLKYLSQWTDQRRQAASRYRRLLKEKNLLDKVALLKDSPGHIYHQFVARSSAIVCKYFYATKGSKPLSTIQSRSTCRIAFEILATKVGTSVTQKPPQKILWLSPSIRN